ncbi:hypothetical protein CP985_13855 [Malaciobacter mytili LMG 24559]|uniref:Methionyl-tRNA formyltransferase n=1 Tax=Malaciobacter mytili LMG 24559 TaxID=1032238 RepID=A0AAX2AFX9_9BACT|nr:formyltransferase family protein [Malaciobacter mytili]AXH14479.1 formyltransferase domain-containing protein [Malaciobacter mytili LMG 24559]RXK12940.1 hypothetical protein CP985_13855 [Malaciobacter mytili LMG 24559]
MKSLNVLCIGFNQETLISLKKLINNNIKISGLISTKKKKEKKGSDYVDLEPFAKKHKIAYFETDDINCIEAKNWIKNINVDVIFILAWSQLFDSELLSLPKYFTIGSHPSKLPYGAGRAPVVWTILEELKSTAVSLFKVNDGVDSGALLLQKEFDIPPNSNSRKLYDLISENLSDAFVEVYTKIINNELKEVNQDLQKRTIRAKRQPKDGYIDFKIMTNKEVDLLIRATTDPYPGAFSYYKNKKVIFWDSEIEENCKYKGTFGQILKKENNSLLVQCKDFPIWLKDIWVEEKNDINFFKLGDCFGIDFISEIEVLNKKIKELEEMVKK